jgi:hypothetical protein
MRCSEVGERLVAWRDDELGRSERILVEEHVRGCAACAEADRRLRASLPAPSRSAPPDVLRRLEHRLDPDRILALADQPGPRARAPWLASWLLGVGGGWRRPIPVSAGAVLVYLVLLAGTFGWGLSGWWSLRGSAPSLQSPAHGPVVPAEQFRPAAYAPGEAPADAGGAASDR